MEVMKMQAGGGWTGDKREAGGVHGGRGEAESHQSENFHTARSPFAPRLTERWLLAHLTQVIFCTRDGRIHPCRELAVQLARRLVCTTKYANEC